MRRRMLAVVLFAFVAVSSLGFADEAEISSPPFGQPVVITSVGQSSGALMARVLAERAGVTCVYNQRVDLSELEGAGTLVIVLGSSAKGLGAAGVDLDAEIKWAQELVDRARELGLAVVAMHIEGASRRGGASDRLIAIFAPQADYIVINNTANEDELFATIADEHGVPLVGADMTLALVPIIAELFGIEE